MAYKWKWKLPKGSVKVRAQAHSQFAAADRQFAAIVEALGAAVVLG